MMRLAFNTRSDHAVGRSRWLLLVTVLLLSLVAGGTTAPTTYASETDQESTANGGHDGHEAEMREPTADEQAAADALVAAVEAGVARLADPEVTVAEGYRQATPFVFYDLRAAHFVNVGYASDGQLLDPERPESLMYLKTDTGELELIGVMFIAPMGEGPAPGGPIMAWHGHSDPCSGNAGVVAMSPGGTCPAGTLAIDFEMLHVWMIDNPDGPYADSTGADRAEAMIGVGDEHNSLVAGAALIDSSAIARALGELFDLDPKDVGDRYQAGESLAEIAVTTGVERAAVVALLTERIAASYEQAVAADDMSAAQRALLMRQLPEQVERMVEIEAGEPWVEAAN